MTGAWLPISWALLFVKFVIPFLLLLPQGMKRNTKFLTFMAVWILAAHYLDCYWLVAPLFMKDGPGFGWLELGVFAGFARV